MKKLGPVLLGIIIGVVASYFYFGKTDVQPSGLDAADISAPKGLIKPNEAIALDKAFNSRHQLISDSIVKRPDNRSSWFSLEDVRNYLAYAENQTRELGYTMDGVRVYLGAYPNSGEEPGYTTMFMVPTGSKTPATSDGSMLNFYVQDGGGDIPGGDGLNKGGNGVPPNGNYPNN